MEQRFERTAQSQNTVSLAHKRPRRIRPRQAHAAAQTASRSHARSARLSFSGASSWTQCPVSNACTTPRGQRSRTTCADGPAMHTASRAQPAKKTGWGRRNLSLIAVRTRQQACRGRRERKGGGDGPWSSWAIRSDDITWNHLSADPSPSALRQSASMRALSCKYGRQRVLCCARQGESSLTSGVTNDAMGAVLPALSHGSS